MSRLKEIFEQAQQYMVGGASAGQRFHKIFGQPLYLERASGCRLYDVDGNEYIDYHTGAGAAMFGHDHPRLKNAVEKALSLGFFMNYDTEHHAEWGKLMGKVFPSCERFRLCNTGSESTQAAIRLARSFTGKDIVIRFEGHFHGMHDGIWFNHNDVAAIDSYGEVETVPDSAGIPDSAKDLVKNVVFNNINALEHAVKKYKGKVAAIILEPISYNCGCYMARKQYLEQVRELCTREEIILIFDEVICGLRMRPGSGQAYYKVMPDLTTMAKGIGGGFPIAAIGGKKDIMNQLNPLGKTVMSGTYSGALMPVLASIECLKMSMEPGFYDHIEAVGKKLFDGINDLFTKNKLVGHARGIGARFSIYFGIENPEDDFDFRKVASQMDKEMYRKYISQCLPNGLFFHDTAAPNSPAHYGFTSQHTLSDIDITLEKMEKIFSFMK